MAVSNRSNSLPLPPGSLGLPVIGESLQFFQDSDFVSKRQQLYGAIFKTHILGRPTVMIYGAEANQTILGNESKNFENSWPASTKALLGPLSLALQTGELHRNRRKLLAQAFKPRTLSTYVEIMGDIAQQYTEKWQQAETLTWYPELRSFTLDVACKLFIGQDNGCQTPLGQYFETWCTGLFSLPVSLPWTKFGKAKRCRDLLLQELGQTIQARQSMENPGNDTLGLLLQARDEQGQGLSQDELKDQILLMLFAGHETLTSAITSFCLLTAQHPEITARLRQEQQQWKSKEALTVDVLKQMTYLEQVLTEVMRLIPPVAGVFRTVLKTCEMSGYQIPQGWSVQCSIGSTHQDQAFYSNPKQFDPERFSPDHLAQQSTERQKYGYVPFGGGIRECLGKEFARLEMKIFAAHLLQNYEWQLLPNQDLDLVVIPSPRPRDGLKVTFKALSD
ncbi:cytochrome P450 [Acaryochloris sp. 'Moss Beach']|uniref:cytochrome P450 n=1 Tax=Acaryochloris sp. 'Moss Beach' TaxID=2740837 RepID=UPI001F1FF057|nr:cytochrome P450 [Acaryochloris sp. 'Moss Beach']UJB68854.1 cytochrome P450 [Acaryochloris sp. 'Moss Beach']